MKLGFLRQKIVSPILPVTALALGIAACSSIQAVQSPMIPPNPAPVLDLAHPSGFGMTDLKAIFLTQGAPERSSLKSCASQFSALSRKTELREELRAGARELVTENPKLYHWCFYGKILDLDEGINKAKLLDEKQSLTLETFKFAIPIARAFQIEFKDSRYIRWAIQRYRALSPFVFQRRVELTPEATAELAVLENPFGVWKPFPDQKSILEKYGLREAPAQRAPATIPTASPSQEPASQQPTPSLSPELSDDEVSQLFRELDKK